MKFGTSYFNATLFRKNVARFWPVWVLYAVIWIYALPMNCIMVVSRNQTWMGKTPAEQVKTFANGVPDMLEGVGSTMAFFFGVLVAMGVFSYLYNNRMAGMMHTLPLRREGLFLTSYLSGLVMLIGPNVLVWALTLGAEVACGGAADFAAASLWLGGQSAMCLFFYSFAVFCAMFTGHLLALPAFYVILNFVVVVLSSLIEMLCREYLYGYAGMTDGWLRAVQWLTPLVNLIDDLRWQNTDAFGWWLVGWPMLVIYAVVGLVLAALALLIYRRRHVESAGDVVAVPVVRPIFKYGVGICTGLCVGFWVYAVFGYEALGGLTGSILLWSAIGYFGAEMLLKKTFRVWKAWKGCAVLLVLTAVFVIGLQADLFGYSARVPAVNRVVSVQIDGYGSYPHDSGRNYNFETEDRAIIEKTVALHQSFVYEHKSPDLYSGGETSYVSLHVTYTMDDGKEMRREYSQSIWRGCDMEQVARDFYCDPEIAKLTYNVDAINPEKLGNIEVSSLWNPRTKSNEYYDFNQELPGEQRYAAVRKVYDAVVMDFAEGNLGKRYLFDLEEERQLNTCVTDLHLYWSAEDIKESTLAVADMEKATYYYYGQGISVTLTPQAEHTIAALTELGVLDEDSTLRLYREIVDENEQVKKEPIYFDPNSTSTMAVIGGADGPTAIVVAE